MVSFYFLIPPVGRLALLLHALLATSRHAISQPSSLMDPIVSHPAVAALDLERRPKKKLKPRHKRLFQQEEENTEPSQSLAMMNELGVVACNTGVVPRKEFFETYAAALAIHTKFPHVRRVADLAGGHGLLSWFLLALDPSRRTAIVVDRCMPASADAIAKGMLERFPNLADCWTYVQADLSAVEPHPSTLLASIHACGTLSDYLVELAIDSGSPLAVAPCCHTVQAEKGYRPHALSGMTAASVAALVEDKLQQNDNDKDIITIGDVVDEVRCLTLENAGFAVEEVMLPDLFTKRNRLILGETNEMWSDDTREKQTRRKIQQQGTFFERKTTQQGNAAPQVRIPLANDSDSIAHCRSIGGRSQASARLQESIPKHFSPTLALSIFLPNDGESLSKKTEQGLEDLANRCCQADNAIDSDAPDAAQLNTIVECRPVGRVGNAAEEKGTGKMSQTYRFEYKAPEGTSIKQAAIPKEVAKRIHKSFVGRIKSDLGLQVR